MQRNYQAASRSVKAPMADAPRHLPVLRLPAWLSYVVEAAFLTIPRITVVGSYATGLTMKVKRLPGRGETLLGTGYRVDYGGKGSNQAVGCGRLGAHVTFIATVGKDNFGDMALELHRGEGVNVDNVNQTTNAPTGVGFIVVEAASGSNCIVIDPGANEHLTAERVRECRDAFQGSAIVLTQLEISAEAASAALSAGRAAGATTILNPAPVRPLPDSTLSMVDILTPNETEAKVLAGLAPDAATEPEQVAGQLLRRGIKQVVMTLGENGALIVTASGCRNVPAVEMKAVDTTGAGDAFNAGLATALAFGASIELAVQFAVVIGGLAVTKEGVIPSLPGRSEVLEFYRQRGLTLPDWYRNEVSVRRRGRTRSQTRTA